MTGSVSTLVLVLVGFYYFFFFFKQKTAYEMRISDWSSDVCSSDLRLRREERWAAHGSIPRGATAGRRALPQALGHSCRRPKGRRPRPEGLGGRRERCERQGGHTPPGARHTRCGQTPSRWAAMEGGQHREDKLRPLVGTHGTPRQ